MYKGLGCSEMIKHQSHTSPGEAGSGIQALKSACWMTVFCGHYGILLGREVGGSLDRHLFLSQPLLLGCNHLRLTNKISVGESGFGLYLNVDWYIWSPGILFGGH